MSQKPIQTIRVGGVKASIWANDRGDGRILHTTTIVRSYLTEGGDWKETNTFLPTQLPELALATTEAFKFIHLHARDSARENGNGEQQRDEADQRTQHSEQGEFAQTAPPDSGEGFAEKVTQQRGGRRGGR